MEKKIKQTKEIVIDPNKSLTQQFLERKKLWTKYWAYIKKFNTEEDYEKYKDTIYGVEIGFFWDDTKEQFYFWENVNKKYKAWFRKIQKQKTNG